jgi:hypothetical protein
MTVKIVVFCDVIPSSLWADTDVSEEYSAFIFRFEKIFQDLDSSTVRLSQFVFIVS